MVDDSTEDTNMRPYREFSFAIVFLCLCAPAPAADPQAPSDSEIAAVDDSGSLSGLTLKEIPEITISVDLPYSPTDATGASLLMQATQRVIEATEIVVPTGSRGITLADVVGETLNKNYALTAAALDPQVAATAIDTEIAAFDPTAFASVIFLRQNTPQNNFETGGLSPRVVRSRGFTGADSGNTIGFEKKGVYGTQVRGDLEASRLRTQPLEFSFGTFPNLTDGYQTKASLNVVQPLLQGFGPCVNLAGVRIAYNNRLISEQGLRLTTQDTVRAAHFFYWDLVFARINLAIARQSLALAADLLRENRIRYKYGDLIAVEVYEAQAGVKLREQTVIQAENEFENAMDDIRELQAFNRQDPTWTAPLIPLDPAVFYPVEIDEDISLGAAMEKSPLIRQAKLARQNVRESQIIARDLFKPQLDLVAGISEAGLGQSLSDSFDVLDDGKFTSYNIGATWRMPLLRRAERAGVRRSDLEHTQATIDLKDVEQQVIYDHREAVRDIETLARQVAASKSSVHAEKNRLETQRIGYEQGVTTSHDLLEVQEDYAQAQARETEAITTYYKALVELEHVRGTLLDTLGFEFVPFDHAITR